MQAWVWVLGPGLGLGSFTDLCGVYPAPRHVMQESAWTRPSAPIFWLGPFCLCNSQPEFATHERHQCTRYCEVLPWSALDSLITSIHRSNSLAQEEIMQ